MSPTLAAKDSLLFYVAPPTLQWGMGSDRPKTHRGAKWIALILFIVFVAYPLSVGPMGSLHKATGDSPEFNRIMDPYYVPLRKLPSPVRGIIARWIYLCRGEKPKP